MKNRKAKSSLANADQILLLHSARLFRLEMMRLEIKIRNSKIWVTYSTYRKDEIFSYFQTGTWKGFDVGREKAFYFDRSSFGLWGNEEREKLFASTLQVPAFMR